MDKRFIFGSVLGLLLALRVKRARRPRGRTLIIGDSQSQTHNARLEPTPGQRTLGPEIARALGHQTIAVGVAGRGVRSWLAAKPGKISLAELYAKHTPETLIVELGGNDAMFLTVRGGSMSESFYKRQLREFVARARDAGVKRIVWLGPSFVDDPEYNVLRKRIALWQSQVLPPLGVPWLDQQDATKALTRPDKLHYTPKSYAAWAASVTPKIVKATA